jgi:hypothetical protein
MGIIEPLDLRVFDFQFSLFRSDPIVNAELLSLAPNYVAYQETTIFRRFATKWDTGECMRYYFIPKQMNVSSFYFNPHLFFFGEIGRVKQHRMPMRLCLGVKTPPGIQTCFAQHQKVHYYKKGRNIFNPCKPYCGVFPIVFREAMCAHVGNKGPRQRYIATFSITPMFRNESGEVLRFNLVNPQYVRGDKVWREKMKSREELARLKGEAKPPKEVAPGFGSGSGNSVSADDDPITRPPKAYMDIYQQQLDRQRPVAQGKPKKYRQVRG